MISRISRNAVKEGFDTLPAAICYFDRNGLLRLINHRMQEISAAPCDHPPDRRRHERHAAVCADPVQRCSARPGRPQEKPFLIPHKNSAAQAFSGLRGVLSAGA